MGYCDLSVILTGPHSIQSALYCPVCPLWDEKWDLTANRPGSKIVWSYPPNLMKTQVWDFLSANVHSMPLDFWSQRQRHVECRLWIFQRFVSSADHTIGYCFFMIWWLFWLGIPGSKWHFLHVNLTNQLLWLFSCGFNMVKISYFYCIWFRIVWCIHLLATPFYIIFSLKYPKSTTTGICC